MNIVLRGMLTLPMMVCVVSLGPLCISSTASAQNSLGDSPAPLQRLTEAITRDMARSAIVDSQKEGIRAPLNYDLISDRFLVNFQHRVQLHYELGFKIFVVRDSPELFVAVIGPAGAFVTACSEALRKMEPSCDKIKWTPEASVIVTPKTLNSPDIIRVVLQNRRGTLKPTFNGLVRQEMSIATGAKRMIHRGEIRYPIAVFESDPAVTLTLTLIPEAGKNIVKQFPGGAVQ